MRNEDHFFGLNKEKSFEIQAHAHRVSGTYYGIGYPNDNFDLEFLKQYKEYGKF